MEVLSVQKLYTFGPKSAIVVFFFGTKLSVALFLVHIIKTSTMFRHYLLVALRKIRRDWVYNILTLLCLAIGVSLFAILNLVSENELFYENRLPWYSQTTIGLMVDSLGENETMLLTNPKDAERYYVPGVETVIQSRYKKEYNTSSHFMFYDINDAEYPVDVNSNYVSDNYFRYHNLKLQDESRMPANQYEIIVSESLLKLMALDDNDINTLTMRIFSENGELSEDTYRIVNVVRDDRWSRYDNALIYFSLEALKEYYTFVDVILEQGADIDDVNEKLKINGYLDMTPRKIIVNENGNVKQKEIPYTVKIPNVDNQTENRLQSSFRSLILSILVLLVGLISYLKRLVITLKRNKRNTIIRYCVGADRKSLFKMQMCEILIMLTFTLLLSLYMSYMTTIMLNNSTVMVLKHSLYYSDVAIFESLAMLGVLIFSAIVIFISLNRYQKILFSSNFLTQKERHLLRNIMIGIELTVAIYGFCYAMAYLLYGNRPYNPLPRSEFNRTVSLDFNSDKALIERYVPLYQIIEEIKELPQVEVVACMDNHPRQFKELMQVGDYQYTCRVNSGTRNYFDFFNVPIERFYSSEAKNDVYINRSLYDKMVADSMDLDHLVLHSMLSNEPVITTVHRIAGIYERDYNEDENLHRLCENSLFMTDNNASLYYFVRFAPGVGLDRGKHMLLDVIRSHVPETLDIPISKLQKWYSSQMEMQFKIWTGGSIVCIFLVILSVTSSITADTERRRKEVSLRKINGAKSRDIAVLFARPYVIILAIAFVAGYSMYSMKNGFTDHFINWIAPIVLAAMTLIVAISLFWKVRQIMHTNPADVIKSD